MKRTRINEGHNTPKLKSETKTVKITHPFHPFYGQTARIIRIRSGDNARLTVELTDGSRTTVEPNHTDFAGSGTLGTDTTAMPLLDIDGLLNIAKLIKQINSRD
jgi:hypothetical protein